MIKNPMLTESTFDTTLDCKPSRIQGRGVFAAVPIAKQARVIEYIGDKINSDEMLRRCVAGNFYIFALGTGQYIDGAVEYNLARFINHSCEPNCEIRWEEDHIWIVARRDISPGEEVTFNYSYDLEDYRHYPCRCGSSQCVSYIVAEEFFDHVRSQNAVSKESLSSQ